MIDERSYTLAPKDKCLDLFIVGIPDNAKMYDIEIEATLGNLTINTFNIRVTNHHILLTHELYLHQKTVSSK